MMGAAGSKLCEVAGRHHVRRRMSCWAFLNYFFVYESHNKEVPIMKINLYQSVLFRRLEWHYVLFIRWIARKCHRKPMQGLDRLGRWESGDYWASGEFSAFKRGEPTIERVSKDFFSDEKIN